MNLTIQGHHVAVTPAMHEYVLARLKRPTRHFDHIESIRVLLKVEKLTEKERRQTAEVTLRVKGEEFFLKKSHDDIYAAIDELMNCLDRQVVAHKGKVQDHRHVAAKRLVTA